MYLQDEAPQPVAEPLASGRQAPESLLAGRQDASILFMLRSMALGHLVLGLVVAVSGIILEATLHQPPLFGLAASGAILAACGMLSRLAIERRATPQTPLAFYLLPYADFVIVGLWLLLFGVSGPMLLFFAYVILSAALLLGSRHATALALIAGSTVLTISLGQKLNEATPAIVIPDAVDLPLMLAFTLIALTLLVYVARLFSLNLERFSEESAQHSQQLNRQHEQATQQSQQLAQEVQTLGQSLGQFLVGKRQTRVAGTLELLAPLTQTLNALLDQGEKLVYTATLAAHAQERISDLKLALERLHGGDRTALQVVATLSKTPLDALNAALGAICLQFSELQYTLYHARTEFQAIPNLTAELVMLRQSLQSIDNALGELQARSNQSVIHLRSVLETDGANKSLTSGTLSSERPLLREMELLARQQSAGLEMVRARLVQLSERVVACEAELQQATERLGQTLKVPAPSRPLPRYPSYSEQLLPLEQARLATGPLTPAELPMPPRRVTDSLSGELPALPKRFTGPLSPPGRTPPPPKTPPDGQRVIHG